MTSESEVVVNIAPFDSRTARISRALTRFPLCASASGPRPVANTIGWAFASSEAPAVEYRTWPIAVLPGRRESRASSKTSAT